MKVQMKTLAELMKTEGIQFRPYHIEIKDRGHMSSNMIPFIGKELDVVSEYPGVYSYRCFIDGNYYNIADWMIHKPIFTISNGIKVTIKGSKLHVGCQTIELSDAQAIATFLKENT